MRYFYLYSSLFYLIMSCQKDMHLESSEQSKPFEVVSEFLSELKKIENKEFAMALGINNFEINEYIQVNELFIDTPKSIKSFENMKLYFFKSDEFIKNISFHHVSTNTKIVTVKNKGVYTIGGVTCSNLLTLANCGKIVLTTTSIYTITYIQKCDNTFLVEKNKNNQYIITALKPMFFGNQKIESCQNIKVSDFIKLLNF
jgi:hypothetical protein